MRNEDWQLAAAVARLHFFKQMSKSEIAQQLNISRFRVARLLDAGLEEGVYTITINARTRHNAQLSEDLADALRLREAIVVASGESEESGRLLLASAAAQHMKAIVQSTDIIGFSWGRTTLAVSEFLVDLPAATVIPLTGMVGNEFEQSPIEVLLKVAGSSGVTCKAIFAPMFAPSPETAAILRSDKSVRSVLDLQQRMTMAVASVGVWLTDPPISQLTPLIRPDERAELRAMGACAEIAGHFVDSGGRVLECSVSDRLITVRTADLVRTNLIAVAGTSAKTEAIRAVCLSGLVTTLVTDEGVARSLLA